MRVRDLIEFDKEDFNRLGFEAVTPDNQAACIDRVWSELTLLGYQVDRLTIEGEGRKVVAVARKAAEPPQEPNQTLLADKTRQKPAERPQRVNKERTGIKKIGKVVEVVAAPVAPF